MTIETLTMFCRIVPSVRVRWTSLIAASGERSSAWVSSTFAFDLAPLTIRETTRRMTSLQDPADDQGAEHDAEHAERVPARLGEEAADRCPERRVGDRRVGGGPGS